MSTVTTRGVSAGSWSVLSVLAATVALLPAACHRPSSPAPSPPASAAPQAPADVVVLGDVDPTIRSDIRYATERNFVGRPLEGYREPLCLLTRAAADALRRVQAAALTHGHTLKVYDCYRPGRAADDILRWARDPGGTPTGRTYHPRVSKSDLFAQGYLAAPTAHSRGSTVDLTLVRLPASSPASASRAPAAPCVRSIAPRVSASAMSRASTVPVAAAR
ncbi:M15 family metallopeptidase, partial [Micromonospora sp. NPDC000207]|uniref:M15 family metallopeptidase n=1 Tax=Micromonospora sp. NPDC000207 TaxID=3154246 RepID=UPI003330430E